MSFYQKLFLFHKITEEKTEITKLIEHCFEKLQPWLNADMYFGMKDKEKSTRVNTRYNKPSVGPTSAPIDNTTKPTISVIDEQSDGDGIIIEGS